MKAKFDNFYQFAQHFSDNNKCRTYLENLRWDGNPVCPHCEAKSLTNSKTIRLISALTVERNTMPQLEPSLKTQRFL